MTALPTAASQWRIELARDLTRYYAAHPAIKMIVIGGSPSRGLADQYSDLDIVVYWEAIDLPWLEQVPLRPVGGEQYLLRKMGEEGVYLEEYYFGPLKVDLGHITLALWEALTDDVVKNLNPVPDNLKTIAGFLAATVLHGAELYEEWHRRLATYPEGLAPRVVRQHLRIFQRGCLTHQGLERGDVLYFQDGLCQMLKNVLGILAGLNRVYFSSAEPRWLQYELSRMPIQPEGTWPRMLRILTGDPRQAERLLTELIEEVLDLVAKHLPEVDTSRIRRFYAKALEPCPARPTLGRRSE
jgi:hypothetical protein